MRIPRNQRLLVRLLAGLCVLGLVLGDLTRAVHLLTAHHVVCAAHGELIEAAERAEAPHVSQESGSGVVSSGDVFVEHHEHCSAAAAPSRPLATESMDVGFVVVDIPAGAVAYVPAGSSVHARPVLAFAPKQGPPV